MFSVLLGSYGFGKLYIRYIWKEEIVLYLCSYPGKDIGAVLVAYSLPFLLGAGSADPVFRKLDPDLDPGDKISGSDPI